MIRPDFHRIFLMNISIVEFEWEMEHLMWYETKKKISPSLISNDVDLDDCQSTTEDYSMFRIRRIFWR